MTCANSMLTIAAIAVFILALWPDIVGAVADKWILVIAALMVLFVAWTGCKCKYCEKAERTEKAEKKKK